MKPPEPLFDDLYRELILDHYRNPRGKGLREPFGAQVHHVNPTCGDEITLRVDVAEGAVADISYDGMGCSISQASASVSTARARVRRAVIVARANRRCR